MPLHVDDVQKDLKMSDQVKQKLISEFNKDQLTGFLVSLSPMA